MVDFTTGTHIDYLQAIEIAGKLSREDDDGWHYHVEITASTKMARIAVYDEAGNKLGYL